MIDWRIDAAVEWVKKKSSKRVSNLQKNPEAIQKSIYALNEKSRWAVVTTLKRGTEGGEATGFFSAG